MRTSRRRSTAGCARHNCGRGTARRFYIKLLSDKSVPPKQQDQMIDRTAAHKMEANLGHLPMLAEPVQLAAMLKSRVDGTRRRHDRDDHTRRRPDAEHHCKRPPRPCRPHREDADVRERQYGRQKKRHGYYTMMRPDCNLHLRWDEVTLDEKNRTGWYKLDQHKNVNKGIKAERPLAEELVEYLLSIRPANPGNGTSTSTLKRACRTWTSASSGNG